jgi:CheY-like chemotaxis protein
MPPTRILIVDDNPANIPHVADYLRFHGFEVHVASEGRQAIEMAVNLSPDLILMDIQMPEMSGFEAMKLLQGNDATSSLKIVAVTARASEQDRLACLDAGAVAYLSKPFKLKELVTLVQDLVEG